MTVRDAAVNYAIGFHWRVFPLRPRGKTPLTPNGFKDATTDPIQINRWWEKWPDANIGIATGSGLIVLDVDGEKGRESLAKLSDLPATLQVSTGKGEHYYFRAGSPVRSNQGKLGDGLDIRAEGGYVVAPPSVHPSGHVYSWMNNNPIAQFPFDLLWHLLTEQQEREPLEVPEDIPEGHRNGTLFRLASKLRGAGLTETEILATVQQVNLDRCNPPLDDSEVQTICHSAARYEPQDNWLAPVPSDGFVTAPELMEKTFPPLIQPVERLICEGLTLFVAASKSGKSWLVLLMAACVAGGQLFLGRLTRRSPVLYLALEDSERRLKDRLRTLSINPAPGNLTFKTSASVIGEGFEDFLENWLQSAGGPALVIVDTLQMIRGVDSGGKNAYQTDYEAMSKLKRLADKYQAAIVCTHHNNKMQRISDPYDKISGSNALMGAADTTILLLRDRGSDTATITYTGRDVWGDDFTVRFNGGRWDLVSDNAAEYAAQIAYETDPLVQTVRHLLEVHPDGGRWTYNELQQFGVAELYVTPFANGKDCGAKLAGGLAAELLKRDGIVITWGCHFTKGNGVEIHRTRNQRKESLK